MKYALSIFFSMIFLGIGFARADARPQLVITWKADSYAPTGYEGKVLPTRKTLLHAALLLIQGGKVANISKNNVAWSIDDNEISQGMGMDHFDFQAPPSIEIIFLKAELTDYTGGAIGKTIQIPVVSPEVVIGHSFSGNQFSSQNPTLKALPFFFNVQTLSDLTFAWKINGDSPVPSNDPAALSLSIGGAKRKTDFSVDLTAESNNDSANIQKKLTFSP